MSSVSLNLVALFQRYGYSGSHPPSEIEFNSQDSQYIFHQPTTTTLSSGGLIVTFVMDHVRGGAKDDHATVQLVFQADGVLESAQVKQFSIGGDNQIPSAVIQISSTVAKLISKSTVIGAILSAAGEIFNFVMQGVLAHTDDGGRLNFPAVIAHAVNNIGASLVITA